jgi:hypothetical protein
LFIFIDQNSKKFFSVIRGIGEMDVYNRHTNRSSTIPATPKTVFSEQFNLEFEERPYLLVDLRDIDEYKTNHIVSGKLLLLSKTNTIINFL